jgi:hypothetical protein
MISEDRREVVFFVADVRYWQILLQKSVIRDARNAAFYFLKPFSATPLGYSMGLMWCPRRF